MPRTREQLEQAARDAEAWLDSLDPETTTMELTPPELIDVGRAVMAVAVVEEQLATAVRAARAAGHSWGRISLIVGTSKQAVHQRYGEPASSGQVLAASNDSVVTGQAATGKGNALHGDRDQMVDGAESVIATAKKRSSKSTRTKHEV